MFLEILKSCSFVLIVSERSFGLTDQTLEFGRWEKTGSLVNSDSNTHDYWAVFRVVG